MFYHVIHNINHMTKRPTPSPAIDLGSAYHLTENLGNSGWKVYGKDTFGNFNRKLRSRQSVQSGWFEPNGCCLPFTNFSVPSRFQTRATKIRPFFEFKPKWMWKFCNKLVNRLPLRFLSGRFCQMVSTP